MTDFHTEGLLDRDARSLPKCANCGGERVEIEDGWCLLCLRAGRWPTRYQRPQFYRISLPDGTTHTFDTYPAAEASSEFFTRLLSRPIYVETIR